MTSTLTIRDIMSRDIVTLSVDMTLREALDVLDQRRISGAPVVAGHTAVGVLSASDLLAFAAVTPAVPVGQGERPEQGELEAPDDWIEEEEAPSAYFSDLWDDAGADVAERIGQVEGPEWDVLAGYTVGEAMTAGLRCVQAGASLKEAAAYLLDQEIHRALVLDGETLVGLVTTTDFLRAIAGRIREGAA
jgi:CBS domain-containing protein